MIIDSSRTIGIEKDSCSLDELFHLLVEERIHLLEVFHVRVVRQLTRALSRAVGLVLHMDM